MNENDISLNLLSSNHGVDQLTLECFTNKQHYNKVVNKQNIYNIIQQRNTDIEKYETKIKNIINGYFRNPNNTINSDLDGLFYSFSNACIQYIEHEETTNYNDHDSDDDVLFGNMDDSRPPEICNKHERKDPNEYLMSYWGKPVRKI